MSQANEKDYAAILKTAFEKTLNAKYGSHIPPPPVITPIGIRHLDALLGSGITSSSYVFLSSTPETGKSTTALQICATFQRTHENSICVYIDAESAAGGESADIEDRIVTFGINKERFLYVPVVMNIHEIFEMIKSMVELKQQLRAKVGKNCQVLVVWDSIAATPSSKDQDAEDVNSVIGLVKIVAM